MNASRSHHPVDTPSRSIVDRVEALNWPRILMDLDSQGCATVEGLLSREECESVSNLYAKEGLFRSRVHMERHGFGRGEYKYFSYPLPEPVASLRTSIYPQLVAIANRWNDAMRVGVSYPAQHSEFIERCHVSGQKRPTPLMLQYVEGDYNCLHQDLYGEHVFPIQATILLSKPDEDFTGGEFVITEQRPRMQSRPMVVPLGEGDCVVFAVQHRPVQGSRSVYRVNLRHGVSRIRAGCRRALGVIFHDAK
jgi:hypothetical protein